MFRRTASITIASLASVGLIAAVAVGATLTLDNAPKAQLEDIQVFPDSDEPSVATPHIEVEEPAPPLTLPQVANNTPTPDSIVTRPAPKAPAAVIPPPTEATQPEEAQPSPAPPTTSTEPEETTPATEIPAPTELPTPETTQADPIEVVLPPVVEDPDVPDDKAEAPVNPKPSKPGKGNKPDKPGKGSKPDNHRDPWKEIVDDWNDKIDKGDWDIDIDWDNGEWKINRDDDDDDDDDGDDD